MTNINFAHSCDPLRKPLFLDLHSQIYGLLKLRSWLRKEFAASVDLLEVFEPRLPGAIQAALEQCEQVEVSSRASALTREQHNRQMAEIDWRRSEIYKDADALGNDAWRETLHDGESLDAHRARLRYCEHCLGQLRDRIGALRASTTVMDPFSMLAEKHELDDDELELLTCLYFRQFDSPLPIDGASILGEVIGRQWAVHRAQAMLFDESRLVAGGLVEVVERGRGALDSTFAVSKWVNLVISGLHPEHPHLEVEWRETKERTA